MFQVETRKTRFDGETCGIDGCPVPRGAGMVVLSVNGTRLTGMCKACAAVVGDTLTAEAHRKGEAS